MHPLLNTIVVPTLMKFVNVALPYVFSTRKSESVIDYTSPQRVEPLAIIDHRASMLPYISDVIQATATSFIAFYLMAVQGRYNVAGVDIVNLLGPLNPARDVTAKERQALASNMSSSFANGPVSGFAKNRVISMLSADSYSFGLPTPGFTPGLESFHSDPTIRHHIGEGLERIAMEAEQVDRNQAAKDAIEDLRVAEDLAKAQGSAGERNAAKRSVGFDGNIAEVVKDSLNLSVGKVVELTLGNAEGGTAKVPVMFRVIATIMPSSSMVQMLVDLTKNVTRRERTLEWRAGQLDTIKDVLFATDLVRARVQGLIKDSSGTYQELLTRRSKNHTAAIVSGSRSINTASSIYILTKDTADQLERESGARLSDPNFRAKLVQNSYMMIMAVVDPQWENVVLYHAGIRQPTTVQIKDLKGVGKGKDVDIVEVIKLLQSSNAPQY